MIVFYVQSTHFIANFSLFVVCLPKRRCLDVLFVWFGLHLGSYYYYRQLDLRGQSLMSTYTLHKQLDLHIHGKASVCFVSRSYVIIYFTKFKHCNRYSLFNRNILRETENPWSGVNI